MPRIQIRDPSGMCWQIDTRQTETLLRAWFDEILPQAHYSYSDGTQEWPRIYVAPMWVHRAGQEPSDPDWLTDSRVLGHLHEFVAADGHDGLVALMMLRVDLERQLREMD